MKFIFNLPPDNWLFTIMIWAVSLVFIKWIFDLIKNRKEGVTVARVLTLQKRPFYILPGKVNKESIEKILKRPVWGVYHIHGKRLLIWIIIFSLAWLFVFILGFVEIQDLR